MTKTSPIIGIFLMVFASALLAGKDGLAKTVLDRVQPFQLIWMQFAGTFLVLALIAIPKYGWRVFQPQPLSEQFLRGTLNISAVVSLYFAISFIPLADATAMMLFAPAVATILSPLVLGEKIGVMRVGAVIVGFAGVLAILRPGLSGDPVGYYFGLGSGVFLGGYFLFNRRLAGRQPIILGITHNALMGTLAATPFLPFFWGPVPETLYFLLTICLAMAVVGQGAMITSFKFAPAAVISPFSYTMLIFAVAIGFFGFGTVPDASTWVGIILIVGSGIFIAYRERLVKEFMG